MVKTFTLFADKDTLRLDVAENGWAKLTLMGQNGGAGGRTQCPLHSFHAPPLLGAGGTSESVLYSLLGRLLLDTLLASRYTWHKLAHFFTD